MTPREISYEHLARTVLKNMEKRNFTGSYAPTADDAVEQIKALLQPGLTVASGGSATLGELNFQEMVEQAGCTYIDRAAATTSQEKREIYARTTLSDLYFLSANAITVAGELVNVDGNGNRVACLTCGPERVVVVAGMNKVCKDIPSAIERVKVQAAPPNCVRLEMNTPCSVTGVCADCHSEGCICCATVITRHSRTPGRIHVILVGEELGF
ncbi:MAG: lactate utilization protein [Clostridiales bacterium]|nr:lactate utilization protein [Clostridiales bacterium]